MPATPRSQPGMTWCEPSWKENGWPRSHDASNCRPFRAETPTYWTFTVLPGLASAPAPTFRSFLTSFFGSLPFGTLTSGLVAAGVEAGAGAAGAAGGVGVAGARYLL